jgi:hypothetical protein
MKNIKNSDFGDNYSQRQNTPITRREKLQAEGKWLWIFKRGAIWLTALLFIYGMGAWLFPTQFDFQITQFYMLMGMFAAFMISSIQDWSKMERTFQSQKINK